MDHDSKKITRAQISAIKFKLTTETQTVSPANALNACYDAVSGMADADAAEALKAIVPSVDALKASSHIKTMVFESQPMSFDTEENRTIHGDALPANHVDPSVDEFVKMMKNPVVQDVMGMIMQSIMRKGPSPDDQFVPRDDTPQG